MNALAVQRFVSVTVRAKAERPAPSRPAVASAAPRAGSAQTGIVAFGALALLGALILLAFAQQLLVPLSL